MTNSIIPMANWGMGTALIAFFALVCVALTAIVLIMIFGGRNKNDENPIDSPKSENLKN